MKRAVVALILVVFFFFPQDVSAHLLGQESFFKVNGIYTALYPVPTTSLVNFVLPQDIAPKNFLIGEPISLEIDTTKLPMISQETLQKMIFSWKFGDGETFEGLQTSHIYTQMGSYILQIYADDGSGNEPILLQSMLVNVLPDLSYSLPKAVILVNGKKSNDPLSDPLSFSFANTFIFDATSSKPGSGISSYLWDFGDMKSSIKKTEKHTYKNDLRIVFPVLRIKDKNGFISDAFVQLNNDAYKQVSEQKTPSRILFSRKDMIIFGFISLIIIIVIVILLKRRKIN